MKNREEFMYRCLMVINFSHKENRLIYFNQYLSVDDILKYLKTRAIRIQFIRTKKITLGKIK